MACSVIGRRNCGSMTSESIRTHRKGHKEHKEHLKPCPIFVVFVIFVVNSGEC
jgi:hypothetical protein